MLIFGARNVGSTAKTGTFFCPVCQQQTDYKQITNRTFAHLFFIPIFPIGGSEEYVECQRCGTPFGVEVLSERPQQETTGLPLGDYNAVVLAGMQLVAAVDASMSPLEVQTVAQLYKQVSGREIDSEQVRRESERVRQRPEEIYAAAGRLAPTLDAQKREVLVRVLILVAFSDNQPEQVEYDCIAQIGQSLGMTQDDLKRLIQATIKVENPA